MQQQQNKPTQTHLTKGLWPAQRWKDLLFLGFGAGILITLDQWTKSLVLTHIPFGNTWLPEGLYQYSHFFRIVHWRNSGAAFGLFQDGNLIFTLLAIIASIMIVSFFPSVERKEWGIRLAMLFQLGGAVGNLIDRIQFGHVIDFISIGNFPVFNIADASISIGVAILLLDVGITEWRDRRDKHQANSQISPFEG